MSNIKEFERNKSQNLPNVQILDLDEEWLDADPNLPNDARPFGRSDDFDIDPRKTHYLVLNCQKDTVQP